MHFYGTFLLYPHSYQEVITDRVEDLMSLSDGLSSQLIEEVCDASL